MSAEPPGPPTGDLVEERLPHPRAPFAAELAPPVDTGEVAAADVLRRVRRIAAGLAIAAAAVFVVAGARRRGLVLTGGAALSIVALRSLEGVVRRLRAASPPAPGADATPAGLGLAQPFRLLLLVVLVILLAVVGRDGLALLLGLSAVPLAVLVEAGLQLAGAMRRERAGDGDRSAS
jgi:hypothetical protein